jgi:predicted MPP superfamily phosphohydrolase
MARSDAIVELLPPAKSDRPKRRGLSRRAFLRTLVYGGATLGGTYSAVIERRWLKVEHVSVPLPRLPAAFDGLTVAQLSDLHLGAQMGPAFIREAIEVTLGLQPDLILLTGDYVSRTTHGEPEMIVEELSRLRAPEGVWAILGNHDHWNNANVVAEALRHAGVCLLRNANGVLTRSGQRLWIAGVDDVLTHHHDLPRALHGIPDGAAVLLLVHEPDFADKAAEDARIGLQLSGHSHGGQISLPFLTRLALPRLARKYVRGLHRVGDLWLYTNRGLGTIGLPLRLNSRPEVTLLTLTAAGSEHS